MGTQDTGLTLEGLANKLEALQRESAERLETLERENAELRQEVSALRSSGTRRGEEVPALRSPDKRGDDEASASETAGLVSRRALLTKAGAAAVAALAAGTLLNTREAKANHLNNGITVNYVNTHSVFAKTDATRQTVGLTALWGETSSGSDAAVRGINFDSGPGVRGSNSGTGPAIEGTAEGTGGTGVKGTGRYGVWGESNQAGFHGVTGRNTNTDGTGVRGVGAGTGVKGESTSGIGVHGHGPNGVYGTSGTAGSGAVYGLHQGDGHGVVGDTNSASRNGVFGRNPSGIGVKGTSSAASLGAVEGHNSGLGAGLVGVGRVGMLAFSHTDGWNAAWGRHTGNGYGVAGDSAKGVGVYGEASSEGKQGVFGRAKGNSQGVAGEGLNGTGVLGKGKTGVVGASTGAGYGGQFQGGKAQLRIVPKGTVGRPTTGSHAKGEIYMDKAGTLFVCTVGGTPGTWRKIATTVT